jgi:diamine N-acetyltransferase
MNQPVPIPLTMNAIASRPELLTETLCTQWGEEILYRPLMPIDVELLTDFLMQMSVDTRRTWNLDSYDRTMALGMCDAINRYDKFRMIALDRKETVTSLLALFEYAFYPEPERKRFRTYGLELKDDFCKFGPCVRDAFQDRHLGSLLMPSTLNIARRFGIRAIVLWGGVMADNRRAIRFYEKHGFKMAGTFENSSGVTCHDMIVYL